MTSFASYIPILPLTTIFSAQKIIFSYNFDARFLRKLSRSVREQMFNTFQSFFKGALQIFTNAQIYIYLGQTQSVKISSIHLAQYVTKSRIQNFIRSDLAPNSTDRRLNIMKHEEGVLFSPFHTRTHPPTSDISYNCRFLHKANFSRKICWLMHKWRLSCAPADNCPKNNTGKKTNKT